jgi:uncharacterized repeat protein (TIGR01451 family)
MRSKNLRPEPKSAQLKTGNMMPSIPAAGSILRLGAVVILASLLASNFDWSSDAAASGKAFIDHRTAAGRNEITAPAAASRPADVASLGVGDYSSLFTLPQLPSISITTYAGDCSTPKTVFNIQDADKTVCAKITGAQPSWRVIWSNSKSVAVQNVPLGTGTSTFTLTLTSNLGDWRVILFEPFGGSVQKVAGFTVLDDENPKADVSLSKSVVSGSVSAGGQILFATQVTNGGPSDAAQVELTDDVPGNTTFLSFDQLHGPTFICTSPNPGNTGTTVCTIGSLARGESAIFVATYQVGAVANGTEISNTANVTSTTPDPFTENNTSTATLEVAATPCQLSTPDNITVGVDSGQAGAVVTYATPTGTGDCGQSATGENGETIPPISCSFESGSFFPVGTTTVICVAQTGPAVSFQVTVDNPGALSISLNGANPLNLECGTDFSDPGAAAIDGTGQSVAVTVTYPTGFDPSAPVVGSYQVTYTATEAANSVSTTRTINVADNEAPSISIDGANPFKIQQGSCSPFQDPGVSANDGCAGPKPVSSSISGPGGATSVDPNVAGTYIVTYTATDGSHQATATRTVIVGNFPADEVDQPASSNQPPTITLIGGDQISIECGSPFTDPGTTATVCGNSVPVTTSGTVDTHAPGTYSITYSATANGLSSEATRIVTVEADNTAPTITVNGNNPMTVECHTSFTDLGAIAHDACAGDSQATASGSVNPNLVGSYAITYNATDPSGHAAVAVTRIVNVVDTTAPIVTAPANVTVYTGAGAGSCTATISDAALGLASATDSCQGSLPTTRSGVPAGNIFPAGTQIITYSATDASNNTGSAIQTITVIDNTPPTISCLSDITVDFNPAVGGAVVTYTAPVGVDNCGATTGQTAGLPSGATFPVGTTTNTFRVTDAAGNTAECSFKVTVALTSLIGLNSVSISGTGFADSYDSAGGYPATKGSQANVVSNGPITLAGSAKVFGNVRSTRAGVVMSGASQITGNATAGTTVSRSGSATVGGTITNNQVAPVITLPPVPACGSYSPNSGISGTYSYNPATGDLNLSGINIATLANGTYCFHNVTVGNSAQLKVNGPVVIRMTGTLNANGAATIANTTGIPGNLRILSSYSGTNGVTFSNASNAHLLVFAPNTGATISGAAPLFGTVVAKTVTISESGKIHYDTRLKTAWPALWTLIFGQ